MKRLIAALVAVAAIAGGTVGPAVPVAEAHDLSCAAARDLANHTDKVGCRKSSPNHAWLSYWTWEQEDHVYWSHNWELFCLCYLHHSVVVHNGH